MANNGLLIYLLLLFNIYTAVSPGQGALGTVKYTVRSGLHLGALLV